MRRALTFILIACALCRPGLAADRKSWNKIRYVGGTIPVKTSPYDWNTTVTVTMQPPSIAVVIAPASVFAAIRTVRITPSTVISLSAGPAAWRRVAEVSGSVLPAKSPALFGLLQDSSFLGIVFRGGDAKPAAILLETHLGYRILPVLKEITGKNVEDSP